MCDEDRVLSAVQASEDVGAKIIDRADEVVVAHEDVREQEAKEDGTDPRPNEACGIYSVSYTGILCI